MRGQEWPRALAAAGALWQAAAGLRADYPTALEFLREALRGSQHTSSALILLRILDADYTVALIDELVALSTSHTYALAAREVLGMLSYADAAHLVPPAIWALVEQPDPYPDDTYLRCAELLDHLGLTGALRELLQRARASDDPDVREVAEDYDWASLRLPQ